MGNNILITQVKMKIAIIALLFAAAMAQVQVPRYVACWNNTCKNPWATYTAPKTRRLQVMIPNPTTNQCKEACYDRCWCAHSVEANKKNRRTQAMVQNFGQVCDKECGGGGLPSTHRRLQGVVNWRVPNCGQNCFADCYTSTLKSRLVKRRGRRAQGVVTNEQFAEGTCKQQCNVTSGTRPN